jgi:hypothetical protein
MNSMNTFLVAVVLAAGLWATPQQAQPPRQSQPPASKTDAHHQGVTERGDKVMGFSHEKTSHHFRLYADGGVIEAEAQEAADTESRDQIRNHFAHIAQMFAAGDFNAPLLIHQQNPPGTPTMTRLRAEIRYTLEEMPRGGRIRIRTQNQEALRAIHQFLRFQIKDHQTGDSTAVTRMR